MSIQTFVSCDFPGCKVRFELTDPPQKGTEEVTQITDALGGKVYFCKPVHAFLWLAGRIDERMVAILKKAGLK